MEVPEFFGAALKTFKGFVRGILRAKPSAGPKGAVATAALRGVATGGAFIVAHSVGGNGHADIKISKIGNFVEAVRKSRPTGLHL